MHDDFRDDIEQVADASDIRGDRSRAMDRANAKAVNRGDSAPRGRDAVSDVNGLPPSPIAALRADALQAREDPGGHGGTGGTGGTGRQSNPDDDLRATGEADPALVVAGAEAINAADRADGDDEVEADALEETLDADAPDPDLEELEAVEHLVAPPLVGMEIDGHTPLDGSGLVSAAAYLLPPERHPADVYLRALSTPVSRATMQSALNTIAALLGTDRLLDERDKVITYRACPWHWLRYEHTSWIRAQLAAHYKRRTANKMLAAVRGTIKEAWRLGLLTAEQRDRALDFKPVPGKTQARGRALTKGELAAVLQTCAESLPPGGARDAAIVAVSYSGLLRRSETVKLTLGDYEPVRGALAIRGAKGNKDDTVYLAPGAQQALADWIAVRGAQPGSLFCAYTRSGRLLYRHLRPATIQDICERRARQAVVAPFTPHDLRRSGITHLLSEGVDLNIVRKLARHEHIETTAGYDQRGEHEKRQAAQLLHVPYPGRLR